ncbi:MAG: glycosyl hydrolase family 28 protein [Bacteroidia bacterium]|nr:glycosyl hydrolase family 28 protein [Bacteroidia bacterium]
MKKTYLFFLLAFFVISKTFAQNPTADGYKGIWFTLGQFYDYGDKYSGGLGTYTADHLPIAIYSPEAKKTFFVYGGTTVPDKRHLLDMVSYYDHVTHKVPKPVVVYDKQGVDDPHDNPSLAIDNQGYIWVFVSGRMRFRPGFIFKSLKPYSIENFELIRECEMTYPQPWWIKGEGFLYLFTKYTNGRELYWSTSPDGKTWAPDQKLAGLGGHYQVTNMYGNKLVSVFNYHPGGNVDKRTNIYAVQTSDMGKTWKTIDGKIIQPPLSDIHNGALIKDYEAEHKLVYINDLNFDSEGNPVILAIISNDFKPGPNGDPREWTIIHWKNGKWNFHKVCESTHNYDMGSLYIEGKTWKIIGPTEPGPQYYGAGGEIAMWISRDEGVIWQKTHDITERSLLNNSYVRRPLKANKDFYAFWADGDADKLSESHLYFSNKKGNKVWELPYNMNEEFVLPELKATGDRLPATGFRLPASGNIITNSYPVPEGSVKSAIFSLKVNGQDVFTEQYKTYHYTHIVTTRAFSVSLSSTEVISEIKISPARFGITAASGKMTTSFVIPGPGYYVVRINQKHKLFIFADLPDKEPSKNIVNVVDLGIDNKGIKTETASIQKALNDVSVSGKTLLFPAGIYKTGSLAIPSYAKIYLCAGAILKGVDEISDFDFHDDIKPKSFIRIKDAEYVSISGRGIIDANGRVLRDKYADTARMRLMLILNSKNVTVDGIIIRDPGSWNTHILHSENVTIQNVKMLNDIELSNTDGFDPDASKNILIENCFAYCSDDNVAVKTTGTSGYLRNAESITVRGCVFLTKKSSLKVGTESRGEVIQDILFENNDVVESDRGMALYCPDGATFQRISYINNRFEDNYPDAKQSWMNFTITKRNPDSKPGIMREILVKDCSFDHKFSKVSEISGFDENHRIVMTIENLQVREMKCKTEKEANIKNKGFADIIIK